MTAPPPEPERTVRSAADWARWHDDYADPESDLSRRLAVVQERIRLWADARPPGPARILSLCAGQGHDVVGALRGHPRRDDVSGVLVELVGENVAAARSALRDAGLTAITVVEGDAGVSTSCASAVPADLLVVCGVFGNISDDDVAATIRLLPMLCAPGAEVIWTRHRFPPDLTPAVRGWFAQAGFEELDFTSPAETVAPDGRSGGLYSVGTHRLRREPDPFRPGVRLFDFVR